MWITENPWPIILILSGAASLLVAAWYATRRGRYAVVAGGLFAACIGVWGVSYVTVTERERVEAAVRGIVTAYSEEDQEGTLAYISPSPQAAWIRELAAWAITVWTVESDMRITDVQIEMKAGNTLAEAHFRANGTVHSRLAGYRTARPTRWMSTWRLEEGEWRMIHIEPLDVMSGEPIDLMGVFGRFRNP